MTIPELKTRFNAVWLVDFEFHQPDGELPAPICVVARELFSGRTVRRWLWGSRKPIIPYGAGSNDLFIAYFNTAEFSCHLSLGWPLPVRCLDLYAEFKRRVCGVGSPTGYGLLGASAYFGLAGIESAAKEGMRDLAVRGGPYSAVEQSALLQYCKSDVIALQRLLTRMLPQIDLPRALIRGQYVAALAHVEHRGVPIDVHRHRLLTANWSAVKLELVRRIDAAFGVYEGDVFKVDRFKSWLASRRLAWPILESGAPSLAEKTFREMAKIYPVIRPLKELRVTLGQLRLNELSIGRDGRNRCRLSPFASRTSRNQPSNTRSIFGPAAWIRFLIKPENGRAIAYVDWEQQEFGIAAALSGDAAMMAAYQTGDPYLTFAKQAGAVPAGATQESHQAERELFKTCALAVQYGMGENALGARLGLSPAHGRELLENTAGPIPCSGGGRRPCRITR